MTVKASFVNITTADYSKMGDKVVREVTDTLNIQVATMASQFKDTYATFSAASTPSQKVKKATSRSSEAEITITGAIYFYLTRGTRLRWALMSRNWSSKTARGRRRSTAGSGRVLIAGKRAMLARGLRPRAGIAARDFDILIADLNNAPLITALQGAIARGTKQ